LLRVDQIAVVRQRDAVRRIGIKRLCLIRVRAAGGGIAHMTDADVAGQGKHVAGVEDIAHETVVLAQKQLRGAAARSGHHRCPD